MTSNLPKAQTCKPERIGITGVTSWVRKLKYIEAGDIRMVINTTEYQLCAKPHHLLSQYH